MCSFFTGNIPLCICTTISFPFICQWTSRLLPCSSYCKQCYNEQRDTCVFFNFDFIRVYDQWWDCWVIGWFYSQFLKRILHTVLHSGCINLHSQQCKSVPSLLSTPSPAFIVCRLFDDGHSDQCEVISHCSFDLHFSNNERY